MLFRRKHFFRLIYFLQYGGYCFVAIYLKDDLEYLYLVDAFQQVFILLQGVYNHCRYKVTI